MNALAELDRLIEYFERASGNASDGKHLTALEDFLSGWPTAYMTSPLALWRAPRETTEQPNQRRDDHGFKPSTEGHLR